MSPNQHKFFYMKHWTPCARANGWHNQAAIFSSVGTVSTPSQTLPEDLKQQVIYHAAALARREHRGCQPNDFRHACHIVALGKNKSSLDLTNDECERVVLLFKLLAQPDSVALVLDWQDAARAKKRNLIAAVKQKAPAAYWGTIIASRYHAEELEELAIPQLQDLCRLLNQRNATWNGRAALPRRHDQDKADTHATEQQPELVGEKGPF